MSAGSPAAYPMVDEPEAVGRVAADYAQILDHFSMVPSLFKSLAVCPVACALAWQQTRHALEGDGLERAVEDLIAAVPEASPASGSIELTELVGPFVTPLGQMLIVTAGLRLALRGALSGRPAELTAAAETDRPVDPDRRVPPTEELDPELVGTIRRDLGTPIVNSVWRVAGERGLLHELWELLGPRTRRPEFVTQSEDLRRHAVDLAGSMAWPVVVSPEAMERADAGDAAPGMAAVLDAYLQTLPRVLVLVGGV